MRKVIKTGIEAKEALKKGLDFAVDAVKLTIGPGGRNAVIGHPFQSPEITNDGVSVAREIYLNDEIEQLGADLIKEIANQTDNKAGDGTTTASVLAQAITSAGFERLSSTKTFIKENSDPMTIKREIDETCTLVTKELEAMAKPISTKGELKKVAFVSVESEEIAEMIADVFDRVGKDGAVTVDDGFGEIESSVVEGFEIEAGLTHEDFANTDEKKFILQQPQFLVTNQKIEFQDQLSSLITQVNSTGQKNLVIIADDFSKDILSMFLTVKLMGEFNVIAVKAPYFGKREQMKDIAIALNATFFDKDGLRKINDALTTDLGSAKKVIIDADKTIIIGASGNTMERVEELRTELSKTKVKYDQEQLKKRMAKLSGGIGLIKVGAETETTKGYLKKKIEDAVNATKYALLEGVVPGGGLALKSIAEKLPSNILTLAIQAPYNQIQANAGGNLLIGEDIVDPVKTTKTALRNACEVAGLIITTEIAIADKYEKPKDFSIEE